MFQSKVHIQDEHSTPKPKSEVNNKFEVNGINSNGTNTPNGLTNGLTPKENGVENSTGKANYESGAERQIGHF